MPLDYSIPLQFRPPAEVDPLGKMGQFLSLAAMLDQKRMAEFQFTEAQKAAARGERFIEKYRTGGVNAAMGEDPLRGAELGKSLMEQQRAEQTMEAEKQKQLIAERDDRIKRFASLGNLLRQVQERPGQEAYDQARLAALEQGHVTQEEFDKLPATYNALYVARMSKAVMSEKEALELQAKKDAEARAAALHPYQLDGAKAAAKMGGLNVANAEREAAERAANGGLTAAELAQLEASGQNVNRWIAVKNNPNAPPEQKAVAQKNLDASAAQSRASSPPAYQLLPGPQGGVQGGAVFNPRTGVVSEVAVKGDVWAAGRYAASIPRDVRDTVAGAKHVLSQSANARTALTELRNGLGPAWGRVANIQLDRLGGAGLDAKTTAALLEIANLFLSKGFQDAGKQLTGNEEKVVKRTLPQPSDTLETALAKLDILDRTVTSKRDAVVGTLTPRQQELLGMTDSAPNPPAAPAAGGRPTLEQIFGKR